MSRFYNNFPAAFSVGNLQKLVKDTTTIASPPIFCFDCHGCDTKYSTVRLVGHQGILVQAWLALAQPFFRTTIGRNFIIGDQNDETVREGCQSSLESFWFFSGSVRRESLRIDFCDGRYILISGISNKYLAVIGHGRIPLKFCSVPSASTGNAYRKMSSKRNKLLRWDVELHRNWCIDRK